MEPAMLGVDIGTSGVKGVLVTPKGDVLGTVSCTHTTNMPAPGLAEHDPEQMWWSGFVRVVRELISESGIDPKSIAGVGCSGIGPCLLPVDDSGRPLRQAILYGIDGRAHEEIAALGARLGPGEALTITANPITTQSLLPKAMWVRDHEPDVYAKTHLFVDAPGYLAFRLTGQPSADLFTANAAGFIDVEQQRKSRRMFDAAEIDPRLFPEPVWPATVVGHVTREAAHASGLAPGTPVVAGTCDAAAECLGAGMTDEDEACLIYGTTAVILGCSNNPRVHSKLFGGAYCLDGRYILGGATAAAGALTTWYLDNFGAEARKLAAESGVSAYEALYRDAERVPPGSDGLVILPYFSGARTPVNDERARGVILGLMLQHTGRHLYRALLESVGYEIRHHIDAMGEAGVAPRTIRAVGGGTRNPLWTQAVSDITGLEQVCVSNPVGAPLGAAYLAALGTGLVDGVDALRRRWVGTDRVVRPDDSRKSVYDTLYGVYRRAYPATADLGHTLAGMA